VTVLDAVDELPRDSLEALLQLIADKFGDLPSFVRLFIAVEMLFNSSNLIIDIITNVSLFPLLSSSLARS